MYMGHESGKTPATRVLLPRYSGTAPRGRGLIVLDKVFFQFSEAFKPDFNRNVVLAPTRREPPWPDRTGRAEGAGRRPGDSRPRCQQARHCHTGTSPWGRLRQHRPEGARTLGVGDGGRGGSACCPVSPSPRGRGLRPLSSPPSRRVSSPGPPLPGGCRLPPGLSCPPALR